MEKKVKSILVLMLVIILALPLAATGRIQTNKMRSYASVSASNNPEITDTTSDIFGPFSFLPDELFQHIDIESAWFYEESQQPDYLYAVVKVKNLELKALRSIYSVHWEYNDKLYAAGVHVHSRGTLGVIFYAYSEYDNDLIECEGSLDVEANTVTWKIPKSSIGGLKQGDILTDTWAWTALRARFEPLNLLYLGEIVKDAAPFIEGSQDYGKDYIIQY